MAYSAPNATPYESSLMPITSRILTIKRGDGTSAGGGTATTVGTFLAENCAISRPGSAVDRKGIYGEDQAAPTIIRGALKFSAKIQVAIALTNTVRAGDFFEEAIDVDAATASALLVRFVIISANKDETAGSPHTYSIEATEDAPHSTQYGGS